MLKEKKYSHAWICTDSDTKQYGRQITENIFEFKEKGKEATIIDLSEWEEKEQEHIINSYGYTLMKGENISEGLQNVVELYGSSAKWIIAECIFETEC